MLGWTHRQLSLAGGLAEGESQELLFTAPQKERLSLSPHVRPLRFLQPWHLPDVGFND